jgi:hypothetical protein
MGLKPPPHMCVQGALRAKGVMLGDRRKKENPFYWERVRLNMPGSDLYDPTYPWIEKIRSDGLVAADIHQYVNNPRLMPPDKDLAWKMSSQVVKIYS